MMNMSPEQKARRGLRVFFILLILLAIPAYWLRIAGITSMAILLPPAVASILTRLILKEGFGDVGFGFRGRHLRRAFGTAFLFPMAVLLIAYGFTWLTGLTEFDSSVLMTGTPFQLPENPFAGFLVWLIFSWTVVTAVFILLVAGEEIGWRGYMLTRLVDSGAPRPLLIHGLIWTAYHIPLILAGSYAAAAGPSLILSIVMFTIIATSFSYLLAWLRLDTGIIWPSFLAHAASNALTQNAFNPVTRSTDAMLWIGESGIVMAVVLVLLIILLGKVQGYSRRW